MIKIALDPELREFAKMYRNMEMSTRICGLLVNVT
jgi:hypothetical protein